MNWRERIVCNPDILLGKPTIKGTRISVELILQGFAGGWRMEDVLESYPHLGREDVLAALACAAEIVHAHRFDPLPEAGDETSMFEGPSAESKNPEIVTSARTARASFPKCDASELRDKFDATRSEWDERGHEK